MSDRELTGERGAAQLAVYSITGKIKMHIGQTVTIEDKSELRQAVEAVLDATEPFRGDSAERTAEKFYSIRKLNDLLDSLRVTYEGEETLLSQAIGRLLGHEKYLLPLRERRADLAEKWNNLFWAQVEDNPEWSKEMEETKHQLAIEAGEKFINKLFEKDNQKNVRG